MIAKGSCLALVLMLGLLAVGSTRVDAHPSLLPTGFVRETVGSGLNRPTAFVFDGDQYLVTQKNGIVQVVLPDGSVRPEPYLTLSVSTQIERGLLGIALHPNYPTKPLVYVYYTTGEEALDYTDPPVNRVSRFRTVNGLGTNERILLDGIPSDESIHNAGDLQFGSDGMLYVTVGDGGVNQRQRAADLSSLNGKILRLRPNGKAPKDNPYYGVQGARPEIYAFGFRNPFRMSFRERNDTIYVGDVGWGKWEEVDIVKAGSDYGWPRFEGPCTIDTVCDPSQTNFGDSKPPFYYYDSNLELQNAIIGGAFADGASYPTLYNGAYFYGDIHGWVRILRVNRKNNIKGNYEFDTGVVPIQFRLGPDKLMYMLDFHDGALYRYVYAP
jgi:glucose/arabinose dehydrogenase